MKNTINLVKISLCKRKIKLLIEVVFILVASIVETILVVNNTNDEFEIVNQIQLEWAFLAGIVVFIYICVSAYNIYFDKSLTPYLGNIRNYVSARILTDAINILLIVAMQTVSYFVQAGIIKVAADADRVDTSMLIVGPYVLAGIVQTLLLMLVIYMLFIVGYAIFHKLYYGAIGAALLLFFSESMLSSLEKPTASDTTGRFFKSVFFYDISLGAFIGISVLVIACAVALVLVLNRWQASFREHSHNYVTIFLVTGLIVVLIGLDLAVVYRQSTLGYMVNSYNPDHVINDTYSDFDKLTQLSYEVEIPKGFTLNDKIESVEYFELSTLAGIMESSRGEVDENGFIFRGFWYRLIPSEYTYYKIFNVSEAKEAGLSFDESKIDDTHYALLVGYKPVLVFGKDVFAEAINNTSRNLTLNYYEYTGLNKSSINIYDKTAKTKTQLFNFAFGNADRFSGEDSSYDQSHYSMLHMDYNGLYGSECVVYYLITE